jgi:hypothetical protein
MLPSVDAAVVSVLKHPSLEIPSLRIELVHRSEDVQEHFLDGLLCFPVIVENCAGNPEDQRVVPFK